MVSATFESGLKLKGDLVSKLTRQEWNEKTEERQVWWAYEYTSKAEDHHLILCGLRLWLCNEWWSTSRFQTPRSSHMPDISTLFDLIRSTGYLHFELEVFVSDVSRGFWYGDSWCCQDFNHEDSHYLAIVSHQHWFYGKFYSLKAETELAAGEAARHRYCFCFSTSLESPISLDYSLTVFFL